MRRRTPEDAPARESVRQALTAALVVLLVAVLLWWLAPMLEATTFWQRHFPWAHPREPLPFTFSFLVAGALAGALWPGTWEGELLERSLRAVGWTFLLYWSLAVVLEAPTAAGVAVLPVIGGPAFTAFRVARQGGGTTRPYVAALCSVLGALALILLAVLPIGWVTRFVLLPAPIALYVLGPALILRDVRTRYETPRRRERPQAERATETPSFFLDLPPGTLRPAATGLGVLGSIATVVFLVTIVAPGVPLSGPVAWISLTLTVPVVLWSVLRREGVAQPRRLVAPPQVHLHTARVQHIRDQDLERLDEALARFIRSGRGRGDLATALAGILAASVPNATRDELDELLSRLPRVPWRRRAREDGLAHLLGGTALLEAVRKGGTS